MHHKVCPSAYDPVGPDLLLVGEFPGDALAPFDHEGAVGVDQTSRVEVARDDRVRKVD